MKNKKIKTKKRHPINWYCFSLEPRTRLRFRHPKGGVTIIENEGPGFIKVDQAIVFDGEFVRFHDSARVSTITSQEQTVHLQIRVLPRTDVTVRPRKVVSMNDVLPRSSS
jgi:hypothetical protein